MVESRFDHMGEKINGKKPKWLFSGEESKCLRDMFDGIASKQEYYNA